MSLMRAMMETMDECNQLAIDRNKSALKTPDDMLDDLPLEVTNQRNWSRGGGVRFPNPFPWTEIGHVGISGDEATRTEDGSCDCTVYRIVISSGTDGHGRCISFGVKGANNQGYKYAQQLIERFYDKMPLQIRSQFVKNDDMLVKV
jgi:hypothetical protein